MMENCCSLTPLCIEKSFYECKSNVGKGCCVQMCGDCSDPLSHKSTITTNGPPMPLANKPLLDIDFGSPQHQFALSKIFDNKRKYVDYVAANVLRQVANYVSVESLHQLCCCLPQNIEDIIVNVTDMDCDRLIRILVTEVIQCYGSTANQLTDWYAFANQIKPLRPPSFENNENDDGDRKSNDSKSKITPKLLTNENDSDHLLNKRTVQMPIASSPSSKSIPDTEYNSPIGNGMSSIGITPQLTPTPSSVQPNLELIKETTVPTGTGYQSRRKQKNVHTFDQVDDRLSASHKSSSKATAEKLREQTQRSVPDEKRSQHHSHHSAPRSNKGSNSSLNSDFVLTIHHERHGHRHKQAKVHDHGRHSETSSTSSDANHHYPMTFSFDVPSSERDSVQIHSSRLASSHSAATGKAVQQYSRESVDGRSSIAHPRTQDSDQTERLLLFKLLASSDNVVNIDHQPQPFYLASIDALPPITLNERRVLDRMKEFKHQAQSAPTIESSKNKLNNNESDKKLLRINHYPNMLADFD